MDEHADNERTMEEPGLYCDELSPIVWVGFNHDTFPVDSWQYLRDGTLVSIEHGEPVDLISIETYGDFDLEFQWRISLGGNSGVLYRVAEDTPEAWQSGPEMQLVDDLGHPDGRVPETSSGAVYGLIAPSNDKILRPAGTFNTGRIVSRGSNVEHWLNGRKVLEYDMESKQFISLLSRSKFKDYPGFGRTGNGHIVLQHHGSSAWFRNIRISPHGE